MILREKIAHFMCKHNHCPNQPEHYIICRYGCDRVSTATSVSFNVIALISHEM